MTEYIKREDVMNIISQRVNNPTIVTWINGIISTVPAVNIEEIKCGEWIKIPITDDDGKKIGFYMECSECGYIIDHFVEDSRLYCPYCGAKMKMKIEA